ncbi:MAG: helix-turn-helix transcriptional regulator [Deltaproteobacteria bacterium]|nr:helix-turn-helix transcriptional regulator [Deltaproteobacteria bacterium]
MQPLRDATRLRKLRLLVGLSLADLARRTAIGAQRLARAERGDDVLRPVEKARVVQALGAPDVGWLFYAETCSSDENRE